MHYTCSQLAYISYIYHNTMRVNLIKEVTIRKFAQKHAPSANAFANLIFTIKNADWKFPEDVKKTFNSADFLGQSSRKIVFDVGGNKYRVICSYHFGVNNVFPFVSWIGTHAEYTELCKRGEQFEAENFQNYV